MEKFCKFTDLSPNVKFTIKENFLYSLMNLSIKQGMSNIFTSVEYVEDMATADELALEHLNNSKHLFATDGSSMKTLNV